MSKKQWTKNKKLKTAKKKLQPNVLQQEEINVKYQEELGKQDRIDVENKEISEVYQQFTNKLTQSAKKILTVAKQPLTPNRKRALYRLMTSRKKLRIAKERGIDTKWYRQDIKIRRQEFLQKVREYNEKEIFKFYNDLQDYEIGERIKRSYKFLKQFGKRKEPKKPITSMKKWIQELEETDGQSIVIETDKEELTEGPTKEEIRSIIRSLVNGKAAGTDGIRNEYVKYGNDETLDELHRIIKRVWLTNEMPEQWKTSIQIPIPKCRGAKEITQFRRITLSNIGYKIYARWLVQRLREYAGDPGYHQAAFTKGRSTDDQMYYVRRCMEENWNGGKKVIIASIDIKKAFDLVDITTVSNFQEKKNSNVYI